MCFQRGGRQGHTCLLLYRWTQKHKVMNEMSTSVLVDKVGPPAFIGSWFLSWFGWLPGPDSGTRRGDCPHSWDQGVIQGDVAHWSGVSQSTELGGGVTESSKCHSCATISHNAEQSNRKAQPGPFSLMGSELLTDNTSLIKRINLLL